LNSEPVQNLLLFCWYRDSVEVKLISELTCYL